MQPTAIGDAKRFYQRAMFAALQTRKQALLDSDTEMLVIANERIAYLRDCTKAVEFVAKTGMAPADAFAFYGINLAKGERL